MALFVLAVQIAACLGYGAMLLRLTRPTLPADNALLIGLVFTLGFGFLGWALFFLGVAGLFQPVWLWMLLIAGLAGLPLLRPVTVADSTPWDWLGKALLAVLGAVFALDIIEALAPPTDADSLAYHFAAPRQFIAAGGIEFILRPLDGAIPYLIQMTYVPALALGGERAMTLWTMATGWVAVLLCYALARPHLSRNGALAMALLFATLPTTVYAAGTGQIEVRMALFAMASAWAVGQAIATGRMRYAAIAGLAAGFYIGAKYLGLIFAAAAGAVLMTHRRRLALGMVFSTLAGLAGFQWYVWNFVHTGDPVFPMLFQWLGRDDLALWSKEHDAFFKAVFMELDRPIIRSFFNLILYPFWVTLDAPPATEGKLVGLGPYGLLILPISLFGAWHGRRAIRHSPLAAYAATAGLFFVLWFVTGSSQRVRHLLPVAPLLFIGLAVAAKRAGRVVPTLRVPALASLGLAILIQLGGTGLFGVKYVRHIVSGEDAATYLRANLTLYEPVFSLNALLSSNDYLFIAERQLFYYLDMPHLFASAHTQSAVNLRDEQNDPALLYRQLRAAGLTHLLLRRTRPEEATYGQPALDALSKSDCLELRQKYDARQIGSRTLPGGNGDVQLDLYALVGICSLR